VSAPAAARGDGRGAGDLRPVRFEPGFISHPEGCVLVSFGRTRVVCAATVEERVPQHRKGSGKGWVTAEYGMLPRATTTRSDRPGQNGRTQNGRAVEIQRLIGRSLRAGVDLAALGERQVIVDCDVIEADGGTRTAAITGGWVALAHALRNFTPAPVRRSVAAVSAGFVQGTLMLDLAYAEDSIADADVNVVANSDGELIEVQGTAEGKPFSKADFDRVLDLSLRGIAQLIDAQRAALR